MRCLRIAPLEKFVELHGDSPICRICGFQPERVLVERPKNVGGFGYSSEIRIILILQELDRINKTNDDILEIFFTLIAEDPKCLVGRIYPTPLHVFRF